jgi:hypothetical protein
MGAALPIRVIRSAIREQPFPPNNCQIMMGIELGDTKYTTQRQPGAARDQILEPVFQAARLPWSASRSRLLLLSLNWVNSYSLISNWRKSHSRL